MARVLYRARQFWFALRAAPTAEDMAAARSALTPSLMALFLRMQPSEQAHSLKILNRLLVEGETPPELRTAALLHDVGKICHPLNMGERVLIVITTALWKERSRGWGRGRPHGWRRAFAVAEQHPAWGAELARQNGAPELAVRLILRHQEPLVKMAITYEDRLLQRLQLFDNES